MMLKAMDNYKKNRHKAANQLKEEISIKKK